MRCIVFLCVFVVCCSWLDGVFGKHIPSFAGPYRVIFRKNFNRSDDFTTARKFGVNLRFTHYKPGQLQYFWGDVYHELPFDDELMFEVHVYVWANNQWKRNFFRADMKRACSITLDLAPELMTLLHGEIGKTCPVKAGFWNIRNQTFDLTLKRIPVFPYGRYMATILAKKQTESLGLLNFELDLIPRI